MIKKALATPNYPNKIAMNNQDPLSATLEYEPTDDAEERLLAIFEYLLTPEKTLDFGR